MLLLLLPRAVTTVNNNNATTPTNMTSLSEHQKQQLLPIKCYVHHESKQGTQYNIGDIVDHIVLSLLKQNPLLSLSDIVEQKNIKEIEVKWDSRRNKERAMVSVSTETLVIEQQSVG